MVKRKLRSFCAIVLKDSVIGRVPPSVQFVGSTNLQSGKMAPRFVSLVENGTHVLFGSQMSGSATSELALSKQVLPALKPGMLCLADRNFFGYEMWTIAQATGADVVWRVRKNARHSAERPLPDGSYISHIYPSEKDRRHKSRGVAVRVINYNLDGLEDTESVYRLVTTILGAKLALKYKRVNLLPPIGKAHRYPPLSLTVIHATEVDPPEGRKPINWKLLTDLSVESADQAIEKMAWYAKRWKIELFFKILKSGCNAEELKLRTA